MDTADLWKFCIILTPHSEISLSAGTEGDAATYQLSWRQKSIFKGQMKRLVVHYFVCAICWRIKILQKAREWFVAVTQNELGTQKRANPPHWFRNGYRAKHHSPYFIGFLSLLWEGRSLYSRGLLAPSHLVLQKLNRWQRNTGGRLQFLPFFNSKYRTTIRKWKNKTT